MNKRPLIALYVAYKAEEKNKTKFTSVHENIS